MKHTPIVHYRVSAKDKKKGLLIWGFALICGLGLVNSQLTALYAPVVPVAYAQEPSVAFDDRLGELLPTSTVIVTNNVEWTRMKAPRLSDVSAYTSRVQETDSSPCIAANGKDICKLHKQGVQTCASNDYKLGAKLKIDGLGECIVSDRMNKRYTGTGRVDFYMGMDLKGAYAHGVKKLMVTEL